jgi:cytochrome c oxidase cbb3-type subunit IV
VELNDLRVVTTVVGFVCFLGICFWAYSKHAKSGFDEAAQLPFTDDDLPAAKEGRKSKEGKENG